MRKEWSEVCVGVCGYGKKEKERVREREWVGRREGKTVK